MQLTCSACGFNFFIDSVQQGQVTPCPRCGKRLRPEAETTASVPAADPFQTIAAPPGDDIGFAFATPAQVSAPVSQQKVTEAIHTAQTTGNTRLIAGLSIALVICILALLGILWKGGSTPAVPVGTDWDKAHRAEIFQLKASAESLALDGKLKESYDKYQQLLSLVGDRDVHDPLIVQLIVSARAGEDRVFGSMVSTSPPGQVPKVVARNWSTVDHHLPPVVVDTPLQIPPALAGVPKPPAAVPASLPATEPVVSSTRPSAPLENAADIAPALPGEAKKPRMEDFTLPEMVSDKQIGDAIEKGVRFLAKHFVNGQIDTRLPGAIPVNALPHLQKQPDDSAGAPGLDGSTHLEKLQPTPTPPVNPQLGRNLQQLVGAYSAPGVDALCVYALLNAGRAMDVPAFRANEPATIQMLEVLKLYKMAYTYHRSLRAAALAVFNRSQDSRALEEDVRWLQQASLHGGYSYTLPDRQARDSDWDNSNSQYGLLGVWAGSDAGKSVARDYWLAVEKHWTGCAVGDGTWPYSPGASGSATMTCAGVASLLVARDRLDSGEILTKLAARQPLSVDINKGLAWLDAGDNCLECLHNSGIGFASYGLYGLERVGLASGFKYFGQHDWYSELAKKLVNEQHLNGSWGNDNGLADVGIGSGSEQTLIDTAYTLLFLARGRHPILFNKLRYDGNWDNRPHDVAHLARFVSDRLERPFNWQVVNLQRNWFDWLDSPLLYISGNETPHFTAADYASLRSFSEAGGLIFTHADGGSTDFHRWVETMVRQVFPKYELTLVPASHEIYSIVYPLKSPPPKLLSVNNGSRLLMIDSPYDIAGGWQQNWQDERRPEFQLGLNIFVYAAGKRNFKNRLASNYIPADPDPVDGAQQVTRLQFYSEWNPEPYAWERFSRYFQWETRQSLDTPTVQLADLKPHSTPLAVLTGTVSYDFLPQQIAATRAYVQAGGVLLIDSCGGQAAFTRSVEKTLLPLAFPEATLSPIRPDHPLLIASRKYADDLTTPLLRTYAIENGGNGLPIQTLQFGKGWVIFSRLDITTGLLGTTSWGILGFDPLYARSLVKNAILWAADRSK